MSERPDLDALRKRDSERLMDAVARATKERLYVEAAEDRHALLAYVRRLEGESSRLRDLVRHQRVALHDVELITDEEYVALAGDHAAVARLESYDALRARVERLEGERAEARTAALHEAAAEVRGLADGYLAAHGGGGDYCRALYDAAGRIEVLATTTNRSRDDR